MPSRNLLALLALALAGGVLGTVAVLAREPDYVVPVQAAPRSIPLAVEEPVPPGYALRTLTVEGICCQGCSAKLHGALMAVAGVRAAAVDPLRGEASALVPEDLADGTLEAALSFDKYTARMR